MSDTNILEELVQKAAAGDRAAFEELYRETCRSVYFTCLGFLKDEQEAQDVTQDVYLTVFEQLGTLEDAGKFKPWLYRIAANKSINCLKKKQLLLPGHEQLQDMETEDNENFLPEKYALNTDKREMVLKIIGETCSDALYQTILLHYFNEFSITEIAEIMECPEGTVKYRLSVARTKIRDGVLRHEKKSGDRLYTVAPIPFLTLLFTEQMQDMEMPLLPLSFKGVIPKSTLAAKTGRHIMLKSLRFKIAAGIAAAVLAVGGVTAVAVNIANQNAEEVSVGVQEGNTLDVANAGNTENTPELDTQPTETEEPQETEESETAEEIEAVEEITTPDETETAETTSEQTAGPEYTYTDLDATMYASQTVNVRDLPSTDGNRLGGLSTNQEVAVTGQCNETGWYRFEYNGQTAYVSNSYVSDTKIEVAAAEPAASTDTAPAQETASASTSSGLPAGVLDLTTLPREQWVDRGDWLVYVHGVWDEYAIAGQDIGPLMSSFNERNPEAYVSGGFCVFMKELGISYSGIGFWDENMSPEMNATMKYYSKYSTKRN